MNWKFFIVLNIVLFSFTQKWEKHENQSVVLKNEFLKVEINLKGAELKSMLDLKTQSEILWQADPEYWEQTSPILFPFVGKSWNDEYHYKGNVYPMKTHGFAKDKLFELYKSTETEVWLQLTEDDETMKMYPFKFKLLIGYSLEKNQLKVTWLVKNTDATELYFQIGGHPGFALPDWNVNDSIQAYVKLDSPHPTIQFNVKEAGRYFTENPANHNYQPDKEGFFPLTEHFFKDDAVIFENNQALAVQLFDKQKNQLVKVSFDTPVFALWTAHHKAPFVCIEPWWGKADTQDFKGDISQRKWMQHLQPHESFTSSYTITRGLK